MSIANSPRCGAKARSRGGEPCLQVALANGRCYYHGGRSTGPKTEEGKERIRASRTKHGFYSKKVEEEKKQIRSLLKRSAAFLKD